MHAELLAGTRFPRSMLNSMANQWLLESLGVEIVDDCDAELEDFARAWLATQPPRTGSRRDDGLPVTRAVREALGRIDARRAAA